MEGRKKISFYFFFNFQLRMFLNFRVRLNNPFVEESDPDDYDVDVDDNVSNDENVEDDDDNVDNYLEFILTNDNFGMSRRLRSQGPGRKKRCLDNKRFFVFFLSCQINFIFVLINSLNMKSL